MWLTLIVISHYKLNFKFIMCYIYINIFFIIVLVFKLKIYRHCKLIDDNILISIIFVINCTSYKQNLLIMFKIITELFLCNCITRETERKLMASSIKRKVKSMMNANQTEVEMRRDRQVYY